MVSKENNSNDQVRQTDLDDSNIAPVLSAVSDKRSLLLFNTIANEQRQPFAEIHISRLHLTRKQYYSRINRLREAGLIRRNGSRFVLTSLGKIVYEIHNTIGLAIHNRWKLQAIDTLNTFLLAEGIPIEERHKLIDALLGDNNVIKNILVASHVKDEPTLAA